MMKKVMKGIGEMIAGAMLIWGGMLLILAIYAKESGLPMPWEGFFG